MKSLRIGFPVSITGKYSIQGRESLQGLLLWHSRLKSCEGLFIKSLGKSVNVELVYYDDKSDESECIDVTSKLIIHDKLDLLIGPYSSGLSMAIAPLTRKQNRVVWNYGGATDEISESGYLNFVNAISPSSGYYHGIIDLFNNKLNSKSRLVALVYANDSGFSKKVKEGARAQALKYNFQVHEIGYKSGKTDFSDVVERIVELSPDLILGVGRTEDDINFAKSILDSGRIDPRRVGLVAASINFFKDTLGPGCEGFLSTSQWEKDIKIAPDFGPAPVEFYNEYIRKYGNSPNYLAAQAFNIGLIIEKCIEISGTIFERDLYETARELDIKTFYGRFKIDKDTGIQSGHSMLVTRWINGNKEVINQI